MKKSILFLVTLFYSLITSAQCSGNFTCYITPSGAANGYVEVYRTSISGAKMDSISYTNVSTSTFTIAVPDSGKYILRFVPSSALYQATYSDSAISWDQAVIYDNPCFNSFSVYFNVQPYAALAGTGSGAISGKIVEGQKYGQKPSGVNAPGNPIGGIIVKGGKNPGGQLFSQTTTDSNGDYFFDNLPAGDYFLLVDIPGLDTASTHYVTLNENQVSNLGFTVDSLQIVPTLINTGVSVQELNHAMYLATAYPNPASTQFTLQYSLPSLSVTSIEIYDLLGKIVKTIQIPVSQPKGTYKQLISIKDLETGIYFIRQQIDKHELLYKLIVTKD